MNELLPPQSEILCKLYLNIISKTMLTWTPLRIVSLIFSTLDNLYSIFAMSEGFAIVILFQLVLFMYYYPVKIEELQPTKGQGITILVKIIDYKIVYLHVFVCRIC
jgi:hypothetical protein